MNFYEKWEATRKDNVDDFEFFKNFLNKTINSTQPLISGPEDNFTYWHEDYLDLKQDYEKTLRALDKAEKDFEEFYKDDETLKLEVEQLKQEIIALQEGGK